ncbi:hypothetical protein J2Y38_002489 [Flavobacterium sp. 2755]|nr:hypothetical protein [Flavobacterium sp. 2755]
MKNKKVSFSPDRNGILLWSRFFNETIKDIVDSGTAGTLKIDNSASKKNTNLSTGVS